MASPEISVIIPVKNGGKVFEECLASVTASQGVDYEIVVVDDESTDNSAVIATDFSCRLVKQPVSSGPAKARNHGSREAGGDILFFTDADVLLQPDTLKKIIDTFLDKDVSALTGVLSDRIRFGNFYSQYKNLWMRYCYLRLPDTISLFYTSASAIRKEIFKKSGGFDTRFSRPSVEDTDFGQKLADMGYGVCLKREITVEHVKQYSFFSLLKTDFFRTADLLKMMLRKGIKMFFKGNSTSVPSSFISSVILFPFVLAALLASLFYPVLTTSFFSLTVILLVLFFILNLPFLIWLKRERNLLFSIKAFLFLFLDIPAVIVGLVYGVGSYFLGNKY